MASRGHIVIVLGVIAPMACLFPALDGLGGATDASTDAASDVHEEASTDAHGDAVDDAADGPVARFCDTVKGTPVFCEDFDEPVAKQPSDIAGPALLAGGAMAIDALDFFSAPRSLSATIPPTSGSQGQAAMFPAVGPAFTIAELAFDVKITPPGTQVTYGGLLQLSGTSLLFVITSTDIAVQEGGYSTAPSYVYHPAFNVDWSKGWAHIDLTLTRSGVTGTSSLTINGVKVETDYALDSRFTFGGGLQLGLGFVYDPPSSPAQATRIDNVVAYDTP